MKAREVYLCLGRTLNMNSFIISDYNYDPFFKHYFTEAEDWLKQYEKPLLDYVIEKLPKYVENILIFGCASGRDFIPFSKNYKCFGFDLAKPSEISWVCSTENLDYYQCSIEDFMDKNVISKFDLSKSLVYTQGVLMYISSENQTKFSMELIKHGCRNIVFHEYPPEYTGPHTRFNPSEKVLNIFERRHFRSEVDNQPTGFLYLNK